MAALNFALQKFQHLLLQGEFLVKTDNTTVSNWATMKDPGGTIRRWLLNFSFFNFRIEHKPGKELVDADHISRQTNLPPATPSERMETQEFEPTYPLPHPLDQWQHLVSSEDHNCAPLDRCPPCVQAMSQQGVAKTLPPRLDPKPWPQPGDGRHAPVYPRQLTMTLLYEAQQKDPFLRGLIKDCVKAAREDWPPRQGPAPPLGDLPPRTLPAS